MATNRITLKKEPKGAKNKKVQEPITSEKVWAHVLMFIDVAIRYERENIANEIIPKLRTKRLKQALNSIHTIDNDYLEKHLSQFNIATSPGDLKFLANSRERCKAGSISFKEHEHEVREHFFERGDIDNIQDLLINSKVNFPDGTKGEIDKSAHLLGWVSKEKKDGKHKSTIFREKKLTEKVSHPPYEDKKDIYSKLMHLLGFCPVSVKNGGTLLVERSTNILGLLSEKYDLEKQRPCSACGQTVCNKN